MRQISQPSPADLLVGNDTGDDALVWRRSDGRALVATCDFFPPIVDDPRIWGRIAAANAASDVYAMGGRPLFALNVVSWPSDLPQDLLVEVLLGGRDIAEQGGWIVAGGHTIAGSEPLYGQAVIGEVDPDVMMTNAGARPGEVLILTKALGTGVIATAVKRGGDDVTVNDPLVAPAFAAAVESMSSLNDAASAVAVAHGASACTDVTGFGLLGHLHKLAAASGVAVVIDPAEVAVLHGTWELIAAGIVPGGTRRNLDFVADSLDSGGHDDDVSQLLADPQTSGGLIFSVAADRAADALEDLRQAGVVAEDIGEVLAAGDMTAGAVLLR